MNTMHPVPCAADSAGITPRHTLRQTSVLTCGSDRVHICRLLHQQSSIACRACIAAQWHGLLPSGLHGASCCWQLTDSMVHAQSTEMKVASPCAPHARSACCTCHVLIALCPSSCCWHCSCSMLPLHGQLQYFSCTTCNFRAPQIAARSEFSAHFAMHPASTWAASIDF